SLLTGLLFGFLPALEGSRTNVQDSLKEGGRSATAGSSRQRLRRSLVSAEVAFAAVLVIGAGLMFRTFRNMLRVDPGFRTDHVTAISLFLPASSYPDDARVVGFYQQLLDRIRQQPEVVSAGAARLLPLTGFMGDWSIDIEG